MTSRKVSVNRRSHAKAKFSQRCAVRITYAKNKIAGQWRAHGCYIFRESAAQNVFSSVNVPAGAETLGHWQAQGDEKLWKFIVSPEFGDRVDMSILVRQLMEKMERDLGTKLEWIAVSHFNTEHPHTHVALRGVRENGTQLDLPREYIKNGIRKIAEDLCTRQLGYRTEQDKYEAERREVNQTRVTSLDRIISRYAADQRDESLFCNPWTLPVKAEQRMHVQARLAFLRKAGLAEVNDASRWAIRSDFQAVLASMQKVADRQRTLAAHRALVSDPNLPVVLTDLKNVGSLRGKVLGFGEDEQRFGKPYMLIEELGAKVHLVYQDGGIQAARSRGELRVGANVRVDVIRGRLVAVEKVTGRSKLPKSSVFGRER